MLEAKHIRIGSKRAFGMLSTFIFMQEGLYSSAAKAHVGLNLNKAWDVTIWRAGRALQHEPSIFRTPEGRQVGVISGSYKNMGIFG